MLLQSINRVAPWLLLSAIVVLTLVPPSLRPTTFVPHKIDHAGILLAVGISFGIGYLGRERLLSIGVIVFCAVIELAQLYVSGRHASLSDFIVDAIAGLIGVFVGLILLATPAPAPFNRRDHLDRRHRAMPIVTIRTACRAIPARKTR